MKDAYNRDIIGDATKEPSVQVKSTENKMKAEIIDETKTSKSYGLLFSDLSYSTYEDLINRGWRRSGKHLYRPHSFESCCPSISIRLDVLKFASRCNPQQYNASQSKWKQSDLANAVLIRGSKSERKVGRTVLRALEYYNSTRDHIYKGHANVDGHSSILPNGASGQTSHVSNMQLDDLHSDLADPWHNDEHTASPNSIQNEGSCNFEAQRQHKKIRNTSPGRDNDKMDRSQLKTNCQRKSLATSQIAASSDNSSMQKQFSVDQEYLGPYLEKLSERVYQVITKEAVNALAPNSSKPVEKPKWAWWKSGAEHEVINLPKWCSFKISQPPAGCKNKNSMNMLCVSTSACAAAAGRSRGNVDKSQLVRSVVASFKMLLLDPNNNALNVQVAKVSSHDKSGFVHVTLGVFPSSAARGPMPKPPTKSVSKQRTTLTKRMDKIGPIAAFMKRHQSDARMLSNLTDAGSTHKRSLHQMRFLTVQSVPAHKSSLQPEVHQLFCRYQTAVMVILILFLVWINQSMKKMTSMNIGRKIFVDFSTLTPPTVI